MIPMMTLHLITMTELESVMAMLSYRPIGMITMVMDLEVVLVSNIVRLKFQSAGY